MSTYGRMSNRRLFALLNIAMTMNDPQLSTKMWANLKNILFSEKATPPSELHSV